MPALSRMTRQREVILEEIKKLRSHPTADELYQLVRQRLPRVSLATVYRNLELLAQQGQVLKLDSCGHQKRFDGFTHLHYHIRCISCGRLDDIEAESLPPLEQLVAAEKIKDYQIKGYYLELRGLCPACRNSPAG